MGKKITGLILIVLGIIPLIMRVLPKLGLSPGGGRSGGVGIPNGNFPSGGMPPSGGIPPGGGPPGGGMIFGILGAMNNPYVLMLGVIFIVVGIILLTHKEMAIKT